MASIKISDLQVVDTPVTAAAHDQESSRSSGDLEIRITQYHGDLVNVLGRSPTHTLLVTSSTSSRSPFFHSGCVFDPSTNELWTTSAPLHTTNSSALPVVLISKIGVEFEAGHGPTIKSLTWQKLRHPPTVLMPAGGAVYNQGTLWAAQGVLAPNTAGLVHMRGGKLPEILVRSYHGREFNSPYGVAVAKGGDIWFTDPFMNPLGEWRPKPVLPQQVYRFVPTTGEVRSMADHFYKPTGIAMSPDESTLYVADAGPDDANDASYLLHVAAVYAFDVVSRGGSTFLANRRLFAKTLDGVPTCVKCDNSGNVYIASGKYLEIWTEGGTLLGTVETPTTIVSFCFGRSEGIFLGAGQTLWHLESRGR